MTFFEEVVRSSAFLGEFVNRGVWPIIKAWWWAVLPFVLFTPAKDMWLLWRQLKYFKEREFVLLEIKLPQEIIKPVSAMEDVFTSLYQVALEHGPGTARETWIQGQSKKYMSFSLEIVGEKGEMRFFVRIDDYLKDVVESIFYAQYPNLEIKEVEDYTKKVPPLIPNKEWDLEGMDWHLKNENYFPIKTYKEFESGHEAKEEKRVDPIARLAEAFTKLKKGEQVWMQFNLTDAGDDWIKKGKKKKDELAKRPEEKKVTYRPLVLEAIEALLFGLPEEKEEEEKMSAPLELLLTPGEREKIEALERKINKNGFKTSIRVLYLGKRENFYKPHMGLPFSFFTSLGIKGLNYLIPHMATRTKVKNVIRAFDDQLAFLKKRRMFRNYKWRVNPYFPKVDAVSVFNVEEMATIFHFPGSRMAPGKAIQRMPSKRGAPPSNLPVEE